MENTLSLIQLGGVGVTKNMYLYKFGRDILIIDCGLGFPDETMLGVDLILPDITPLQEEIKNGARIVGLALTHGHEDHIGALPYILPELVGEFPMYATPLTAGFTNAKLTEFGANKKVKPINFNEEINIGPFSISFIRVTHSVPDTSHIFIKTPMGNFYHGSDFKLDDTPFDQNKTDYARIKELSRQGVLCLLSDALGAEKPGKTPSETNLTMSIEEEMAKTQGKFILTTYSSNISRLNQALLAAEKLNRKVCFVGRSLIKAKEIAVELGYMKIPEYMEISLDDVRQFNRKKILLIVAGSQGQEGSSLSKIVNGSRRDITINREDTVVFSADPIPGNEVSIYALVDEICRSGAKVLYSTGTNEFHVSGHGYQEDLKELIDLVKPKKLLPIGGSYRHLVAYRRLAQSVGYKRDDVLIPEDEEVVFSQEKTVMGRKIPVRNIYVDQISGEEIESFVLRDREKLATEGIVIVMVEIDPSNGLIVNDPHIVMRGFSQTESIEITRSLTNEIKREFRGKKARFKDLPFARKNINNLSEKLIYSKFRRRPLVLPVIIEV